MQGQGRGAAGAGDGGVMDTDTLAFAHEDERLPWLEADDDAEEPGVDTGRVIAFVLIGLVALALIIGALWWVLRARNDGPIVADGSTIEAPAGPYKVKPQQPGGAKAVGTGDTSFAVAEGQDRTGKLADTSGAPRPSIDREQAGSGPAAASGDTSGVGVQVGAYSSRDRAEAGWSTLSTRFPALSGIGHRIVEGSLDGSPIFRLQAVAGDAAAAATLCNEVRSQGGDCQVKN